jgi:tetratricopeptide (TPR) repeat protein
MTGAASPPGRPPGRIITFFSYKGGTGRSMALANVAWVLASSGQRVLMMDWDFEAPGLHRYVHPFLSDPELVESAGLIDFFLKFATAAISVEESNKDWFQPYTDLLNYTRSVDFTFPEVQGKRGYLDLIPAGLQDGQYSVRVNGFNWERFYTAFGGGIFLEAVKQKLRREYDYILIDSRTGVSDTSGICTVQMPDELVACFTLNRQSIAGCAAVARSAASQRSQAKGGAGLRVWPVPTRIEDAEKAKRDRMQSHAVRMFGDFLAHMPADSRQQYWGEVGVRYQPFYAYEEVLAVFGDRAHTTGSMLSSMESIGRYLTDGAVQTLVPMPERARQGGLKRYLGSALASEGVVEEESAEAASEPAGFTFYVSYARGDRAGSTDYELKFVRDLEVEIRTITGDENIVLWLDNYRLESGSDFEASIAAAVQKSSALLALVSPTYMQREFCMAELRQFQSRGLPIVNVNWVPVEQKLAPNERTYPGIGNESYAKQGLRRLMQIRRYESDYFELISELANAMAQIARSTGLPRPQGDSAYTKILALAKEYQQIRQAMPAGGPRTARMAEIAAAMGDLTNEGWSFFQEFMTSDQPGERLAAIMMLQVRPAINYVEWLGAHVNPKIETPFVGYQAAVALRIAAQKLPVDDLPVVERSIIAALQSVEGKSDTGRDDTLRLALNELRQRGPLRGNIDFSKICFVIMPFGRKTVDDKAVDFDWLYDNIFVPAIGAVTLPEGGKLEPRRTDTDFFRGDIKLEMFNYLEYSRFVLADISGLNFNVAYELGVRHRAREAGTAIFRQSQFAPPFDISSIKAFPYEYATADEAEKSRVLITRVISASLAQNRLDSPVRLALSAQHQSGQIDELLKQAENEVRKPNWAGAMDLYRQAIAADPNNPLPRMKLGLLCRDRGIWDEAMEQFTGATVASPSYSEAWREKGMVENKLAQIARQPLDADPAPGEASVRRAIELNPRDFDAFASLGGVLKRAKRFPESLAAYEQSLKVSDGHPYPLLNALKLRVQVNGHLALSGADKLALMRAARIREAQSKQDPPFDKPWCFFDLAEIKLYQGDTKAFLDIARQGLEVSDENWQGKTFVDSLHLLLPAADELPGLKEGVAELEKLLPDG